VLIGFEARIVIIVPLYWGRYLEITFHFSPSADLLNTNDSAFSIEYAASEADTITFWGSDESTSQVHQDVGLFEDSP